MKRSKLVILWLLPRRQQRKSWESLKGQVVPGPWMQGKPGSMNYIVFWGAFSCGYCIVDCGSMVNSFILEPELIHLSVRYVIDLYLCMCK